MAKKKTEVELEFSANTQQFDESIKAMNAEIKTQRKELKLNATELKGDADNADLLAKRQKILTQEQTSCNTKIGALNSKIDEAKRLFGDNSKEVKLLNDKLIDAKTQLAGVENEIKSTDAKLDALKNSTDKSANEFDDLTDAVKKSGREAEQSSKGGWTVFKQMLADFASNTLNSIKEKLKSVAKDSIEYAANLEAANSQFSQVFNDLESTASENLSKIADSTGVVETRMKESYTKIAAFAKTTGMETADSLNLADRAMIAIADSAAFYDRSLEDVTDSLQSFLKGNFENDAALGLSCTETTRNAAANALYGKSFKDLSEQQKQLTLLQMVEDANALSGALGQSARETDTWTNQTGNLEQAWNDMQANLGQAILPEAVNVVKDLSEGVQNASDKVEEWTPKIQGLISKLSEMFNWGKENKGILAGLATTIGVVAIAVTAYNAVLGIATAIQTAKKALNIAETASIGSLVAAKWAENAANISLAASGMAALWPILLIVAAIAAVIAIIVLVVKHFDTLKTWAKDAFETAKNKCTEFADGVKQKFRNFGDSIVNGFRSIPDKIGELFGKLKSKIKTPHISVTYSTEGTLAKVAEALGLQGFPKLHINWNKFGGVFENKTIVAQGFAEAGDAEMALPLNDRSTAPFAANIASHMPSEDYSGVLHKIYNELAAGNSSITDKIVDAIVNRVVFKLNRREIARAEAK